MSYPLVCAGGFPNPLKEGVREVLQVRATVSNPAVSARVTLIDDANIKYGAKVGKVYDDSFSQSHCPRFVDTKLTADSGGDIDVVFAEPVKIRHAISVVNADNIVAGSLCVYAR